MTSPPEDPRLTLATALRHGRLAFGIALRAAPGASAALVVLAVLAGVAPVAAAWLLKLTLDLLVEGTATSTLLLVAIGLALIGVVVAAAPRVNNYAEASVGRAVRLAAFDRLFTAVNSRLRGLARLEEPRFHDRLQLAHTSGSSAPGEVTASTLMMARDAITMFGFIGTLLVINPWLALAVAVSAVPTMRAEILLARRRVAAMGKITYATRRQFFYTDLLSAPRYAKEVRLFGLGTFFRDRMLRELGTINTTERGLERRELVVQSVLALLGAVVAGVGLVWAIRAAQTGTLTIGDVSVFVAAVAGVQGTLGSIIETYGRLHQCLLMLDHYQAVMTCPPDLPVPAKARPVPPLRDAIEFRDVWFRYGPGRPWVLRGVNLTIQRGQAVALVGVNGAGKSTIVKLLCRFYDPSQGTVTWDGVDLREVDPAVLRERISTVFQDYVDYELSAAENIGLGDLPHLEDRQRIEAAAQRAGIHDALTRLPAGYDTMLTRMFVDNADWDDPETGVLLSGGQQQRLAVARAFLRDQRDLLILDEPSAGLDADAEAAIHDRLRTHRAGRTSLLISHRLSTVRDADQIVVIDDGEVCQRGTHAELMATGGVYARLFTLQARGYTDAAPDTVPDAAQALR